MTKQKSDALMRLLMSVRSLNGAVCELGVFEGGTLLSMAKAVPEKQVYGFDTFEGMPKEPWRPIDFHKPGEFQSSFDQVVRVMPSNVMLVKGLFPDSAVGFEHMKFCFAHVDMDLEKSTEDAIDWLRPRMVRTGIVVFDDYRWKNCPGIAKAIDRAGLPVRVSALNQCYWMAP